VFLRYFIFSSVYRSYTSKYNEFTIKMYLFLDSHRTSKKWIIKMWGDLYIYNNKKE
jgi:hypothetical protein